MLRGVLYYRCRLHFRHVLKIFSFGGSASSGSTRPLSFHRFIASPYIRYWTIATSLRPKYWSFRLTGSIWVRSAADYPAHRLERTTPADVGLKAPELAAFT